MQGPARTTPMPRKSSGNAIRRIQVRLNSQSGEMSECGVRMVFASRLWNVPVCICLHPFQKEEGPGIAKKVGLDRKVIRSRSLGCEGSVPEKATISRDVRPEIYKSSGEEVGRSKDCPARLRSASPMNLLLQRQARRLG